MKMLQKGKKRLMSKRLMSKVLGLVLVMVMVAGTLLLPLNGMSRVAQAAGSKISSMEYYSAGDGPILSESGVGGLATPFWTN